MARHELAFCTPVTSRMYQRRHGARLTRPMPFGEIMEWHGVRLSTHPAGHVFGSAMLLAEDGKQRLLYTGDFKLGPSATAEEADPPPADVLVMETTFGDPQYRLPPREKVVRELIEIVRDTLQRGQTPVIQAYVLGKAQEVTKILTKAGFEVLQHPLTWDISQEYEAEGCSLGACGPYDPAELPGKVVVAPPRMQKAAKLPGLKNTVSIGVTGWAAGTKRRWGLGVDHAVPLSDHADYDGLLECIAKVKPQVIYCTHGPLSFVDHLRELGHNAFSLNSLAASPVG